MERGYLRRDLFLVMRVFWSNIIPSLRAFLKDVLKQLFEMTQGVHPCWKEVSCRNLRTI